MARIRFIGRGNQRKFLDKVVESLGPVSLRGLLQFGFDVKYSALKNYYNEFRIIPEELFLDMCEIAELDKKDFSVEVLNENWGKVIGGKFSKMRKLKSS